MAQPCAVKAEALAELNNLQGRFVPRGWVSRVEESNGQESELTHRS